MKKFVFARCFMAVIISVTVFQSCQDKKKEEVIPPVPDQTHTQEFDNIASATSAGWQFRNLSEDHSSNAPGFVNTQGLAAFSGSGSIMCTYEANNGDGLISVWAISPKVILQNGDKISFYTISANDYSDPANVFPDRLQLRVSPYGGDEIADDPTAVGGFTVNLVDVNPSLSATLPSAYPDQWTKFEGTISGLSKPVEGHYAFRYFVADGGTAGANSNAIAIDKVIYTSVNH